MHASTSSAGETALVRTSSARPRPSYWPNSLNAVMGRRGYSGRPHRRAFAPPKRARAPIPSTPPTRRREGRWFWGGPPDSHVEHARQTAGFAFARLLADRGQRREPRDESRVVLVQ